MSRVCVLALLIFCAQQKDCVAQTSLREHLGQFAGAEVHQSPTKTVHGAAREYILGRQFELSKQYAIAIAHYKKATQLDDKAYAPWVGIAHCFTAMGRYETVIAVWREVLKRNPMHADALLVVGLDDARIGEFEHAKQRLSRSWLNDEVDPVETLLRDAALLSVFQNLQDYNVVKLLQSDFQNIFNDAVADLVHQNNRGNWLGVLQQLVDVGAVSIAEQLVTSAYPLVDGANLSALLTALPLLEVAALGDGSLTEKVYRQVSLSQKLPLSPRWFEPVSLAEAYSMAAQTMSVLGAIDAPIQLYESSLSLNPKNSMVLNNLAWMKLNRDGPTEKVKELCNLAFELEPEAPYIMDTVGWLYVLSGYPEKAIPLFVEALQSQDQLSFETHDHLGDAYWLVGDSERAITAWRSAAVLVSAPETKKAYLEGYMSMAHTVWGISVATPEALYDLELGEVTRKLMEKITAYENGTTQEVSELVRINGAN